MAKQRKSQRRLCEGLPVVDANADVTLNITPQDVKNSKVLDPGNCAAAVAGKRELHREVKVFLSRMYVKEKNHWTRFVTPGNAAREIVAFDRGSEFMPGEYVFKAPSPGQRLGSYHATSHGHKNQAKRMHHVTAKVRLSAKQSYRQHQNT